MPGQRHTNDVALAILELTDHLCRVCTDLHAKGDTKTLGKPLTEHILQTHATTMIIIIGIGTGERDDLTITDEVVKGEMIRGRHHLGTIRIQCRTPWRRDLLLF